MRGYGVGRRYLIGRRHDDDDDDDDDDYDDDVKEVWREGVERECGERVWREGVERD